jgi:hypothetical protein
VAQARAVDAHVSVGSAAPLDVPLRLDQGRWTTLAQSLPVGTDIDWYATAVLTDGTTLRSGPASLRHDCQG